jgi:pimeloyl-ACP methyl ester carboxylesterase
LALAGWSYGGGMGLIYAANHAEVGHVCSIAGTDHGEFAREYQRSETFAKMLDEIFEELKHPDGPVRFSGKRAIRNELIRNPDPYDLLSHAAKLAERDVLLIGGWDDLNVTVENHLLPCYRRLKELQADKVGIEVLPDNHSFDSSRAQLVDLLAKWIGILY